MPIHLHANRYNNVILCIVCYILGGSENTNILSIIGNGQKNIATKIVHELSSSKSISLRTIHLDNVHKRGLKI